MARPIEGAHVNYYNDNNPHVAQWLRNLISRGLIPDGIVDDRSIRDVHPRDLAGFTQCHFFAGIGGWALALALVGWPEDRPVWTASCPCQPFSIAGKGLGEADDRHLWPVVAELVAECRPAILFGEQVASRDGREWLSRVRLDLESMGAAVGAADLCAAGIGAPHMRQRLYFGAIRLANADDDRRETRRSAAEAMGHGSAVDASRGARGVGLADADSIGFQRGGEPGAVAGAASEAQSEGRERQRGGSAVRGSGAGEFWRDAQWLDCKDGKSRRVKPGISLLVDGLPRGVAGSLAGFGNAIVPPLAAEFIKAFDDAPGCDH